ncbi:MAG: iron ABC transporter permease [Bryobacterales bacterium]
MLTSKRFALVAAAAAAFLLAVLIVAPLIGSSDASLLGALRGESPDREIVFGVRMPRVLLGALAGGALALAGVVFQALLRDALATPFTLGVSNGAALGAVLAICLGWRTVAGLPAIWISALVGALCVMALVVSLASEGRRMSSFTLLLTGVTINSIAMAAILFLHYSAGLTQSFAIVRWLMGGIDSPTPTTLISLAVGILFAFGLAVWKSPQLNLLSVGEDWASTRGVDLRSLMRMSFFLGSFLTAAVTAFTGPIGFVGLIVPHALRMVVGADHRLLVPAAFCVGGGFLVLCDTIARTAMAPTEIPVGVITAMLGGPFFIWLLRSHRGSLWQ